MALITTQKNTISDHGDLLGLGDDDHTQYLLVDGSRGLSANWDAGAFNITADDILVDDDVYAAGWNANLEVPTKNAVYDKIETLIAADLTISNNTNNYFLTATGTNTINGESNLTFDGSTLSFGGGIPGFVAYTWGKFTIADAGSANVFDFIPGDNWNISYSNGSLGLSLDVADAQEFHFQVDSKEIFHASKNIFSIGNAINAINFGLSNYAAVLVDTIETAVTDDDTHLPTSGAIVDYCAGFTSINNNTNNYLLTATGTTALNGEANLTFDGSTLLVTGDIETTKILEIPATSSSTVGVINQNNTRFIYTYGGSNLFVGLASGNFTLTGIRNLGIGTNALDALSSGSANIAIGYRALSAVSTGSNNTAVGYKTLYVNTGLGNLGFGHQAATSNTSGNYNLAIGYNTLLYNQTGSGNVIIGYNAGSGTALATKSGNVLIGYYVASGAAQNTLSNELWIDNSSTTTPLIHGDFSTNILTINDVLVLAPRAAAPGSPVEGMMYSNSTDNHLYFYNGSAWVQLDN